eukprot:1196322-Prorocentrum_minimum.AAC.5
MFVPLMYSVQHTLMRPFGRLHLTKLPPTTLSSPPTALSLPPTALNPPTCDGFSSSGARVLGAGRHREGPGPKV